MEIDYEKELLKLHNKYLAETVLLMAQDLTRVGMSEYQPDYAEFLELAKWSYGILNHLGVDFSELETYTEIIE